MSNYKNSYVNLVILIFSSKKLNKLYYLGCLVYFMMFLSRLINTICVNFVCMRLRYNVHNLLHRNDGPYLIIYKDGFDRRHFYLGIKKDSTYRII